MCHLQPTGSSSVGLFPTKRHNKIELDKVAMQKICGTKKKSHLLHDSFATRSYEEIPSHAKFLITQTCKGTGSYPTISLISLLQTCEISNMLNHGYSKGTDSNSKQHAVSAS